MIRHFHDTILGDLPSGWTVHRLRDLLTADYPGDWGSDAGEVEVTCIRGTNFTAEGQLDLTKLARRFLPRKQAAIMQPKQGDIFLEKSRGGPDQPVARVGFVKRDLPDYAFSNFVHLLRPDPEAVMPTYLGRLLAGVYLSGVVVRMEQQTTGIRNLNLRDYLDVLLPLPTPDEQAAIASILDAADTAIERARVAVEKAAVLGRNLRETLVVKGDWPRKQLGDFIADGPTNGVYRPESDYGVEGTPIIRIDSFGVGTIRNIAGLRRVRLPAVLRDRYTTGEGDILINRVNSLDFIGKAALVPPLPETTIFESNMMRLRLRDTLRADYLIEVLLSSVAKRHWLARAKAAVNQASINQRDVASLRIPVPSPDKQKEIAAIMAQQRRVFETMSARLAALERLKRGLMQDLLTGRVRVKPPAGAPAPAA